MKTAILIVNLGSPESPTPEAVKPYLRQFLSDTRVIETPTFWGKIMWQAVLNGIILRKRPAASAAKYKSIWLEKDSPLLFYTRETAQKLQEKSSVYVDFAMRYGKPAIQGKLAELQEKGFHKIVIVPMYAQYSATTVASIMDEVARYLLRVRYQPQIRAIQGWHTDSGYIEALALSVQNTFQDAQIPKDLILSFHGIPKKYADAGDPYRAQCEETARLLQEKLPEMKVHLSFQSRFGPDEWLQPYAVDLFENFPKKGIKNVAVVCPGFCADCLETLEEIALDGRETFLKNGGKKFTYIPALNAQDFWIEKLWAIIQKELVNF